jgi:biopolymer transport protein ExbB/TolQ
MEDPKAFLYLIVGIVCLLLYRVLKKRWNIQNNDKKNLFKLLFKNIDNKK